MQMYRINFTEPILPMSAHFYQHLVFVFNYNNIEEYTSISIDMCKYDPQSKCTWLKIYIPMCTWAYILIFFYIRIYMHMCIRNESYLILIVYN